MNNMNPKWHYNKLRAGDTVRDPIQGEFFSTESIENSAEALIREGIQNSLDARRGEEILRIRIRITGMKQAIKPDSFEWLMNSNWEHIEAEGNGLEVIPTKTDSCHFISFEDFGTTGLEGDPTQWKKIPGQRNNFFNFFRAEGHSDKSESDRGRWGVGKTVFPRSSNISSFWAVTRRASDNRILLMGRTILKSHDLKNGSAYVPDGYFGVCQEGSDVVLPVENETQIAEFCNLFKLHREDEPGLSIVVPYYDLEETTAQSIIQSIVSGYFLPILSRDLEIEIVDEDEYRTKINHSNLLEIADSQKNSHTLMPVIQLSEWSGKLDESAMIHLSRPPENLAPKWKVDLFEEGQIEIIRDTLKAGNSVAIRVSMPVREKRKPPVWSYFDVFIRNEKTEKRGRPIYVRDGISISDVRGRTTNGVASLVLITDKPLATLLGDSENPAHTQWQKDCSHYRNKYDAGVSNISFVADSVAEILRLISESDLDEDPSILIDLFSIPVKPESESIKTKSKKKKKDQPEDSSEDDPVPPPPKPKKFRISKTRGGFYVTKGDFDSEQPEFIQIEVAYDDRSTNPLKNWYKTDFDMKDLSVTSPPELSKNVKLLTKSGNQLLIKVLAPDFRVDVAGFDDRRNLYVRANVTGDPNGN